MEVADERVAAPARPDFREGPRRKHAHRNIRSVRVVEDQARRRDRERAARGPALKMDRIPWRPAAPGAVEFPVMLSSGVRSRELGCQRQERVRVDPPGFRSGRSESAFESTPKTPQRGLGRRPRPARQAARQEHPAVLERERRSARVERTPAGVREERPAPLRHPRLNAARAMPRLGPVPDRGPVARARPVYDLHHGALRRRVGKGPRQRFQGPLVYSHEGRKLQQETATPRIDVALAPLVPCTPGQQLHQRSWQGRERPGLERVRSREQVPEPLDHGSLHCAGSSTVRTQ